MAGTGQTFREFDAYVFGKADGRNTRWEWSKKRGWYKFGTRHGTFDETDAEYGPAIPLFRETLAEPLERVARDQQWARMVAFVEYWGERSLGGVLVSGDVMHLSLFDVSVDGERLLGPREFVKIFVERVESVPYIGRHRWTRGFVDRVFQGDVEGLAFEGAVGKGVKGEMAKAKTRAWLEAVRVRFAPDVARRIVES